jgi:hypothetical protein
LDGCGRGNKILILNELNKPIMIYKFGFNFEEFSNAEMAELVDALDSKSSEAQTS